MKKIISTIAVMAMLVANFATVSFAAVTSETPAKLVGSLDKIDTTTDEYVETYEELCAEFVDEGYDVYSLKISVSNSPLEVNYKSTKYTGTTATYFSAQLPITTDATIDDDCYFLDLTGTAMIDNGILKYAESDGSAPIDSLNKKSVAAGDTVLLVETVVAIDPSKTISFKWNAAEIGTSDFANSKTPTADTYKGYILNAADGLLVPDNSSNMSTKKEDTKVEKYFTATLPACEKADANNAVQFQFNNGTKDGVFNFAFGTLLEAAETVTVGLEVTEVPSDVTVTLNNVVWTTVAE